GKDWIAVSRMRTRAMEVGRRNKALEIVTNVVSGVICLMTVRGKATNVSVVDSLGIRPMLVG
ncbi:hypothetical protein A2U01_0117844, partial [Trifolium medium]|nr:hypothetical protein [Trifolium medium]